jgi:hypothetical protein
MLIERPKAFESALKPPKKSHSQNPFQKSAGMEDSLDRKAERG